MSSYLFIESRDPFESNDVAAYYDLAAGLAKDGAKVTVFLVQNGVFAARAGVQSELVTKLASAGVEVLADEFSLRERAIKKLVTGVTPAKLDRVIDHLEDGRKAVWH